MLATIVVFLFVLTAQAGASVMAAAGVRSDSAFTTTGGVYAEGPFGAGKYAWYVDQTDHEAILRGFDQSDPANPNQLAEVNGRSGVGAGRIGSVSGVAFQPSGDKLLVLDKAYDRLIIFPRKNDGSTADPVSYPNAGTRHLVEPWFLFYPWWSGLEAPGGLAVDAGDSGRVYISDTGHSR
jgi:hypothetical protein